MGCVKSLCVFLLSVVPCASQAQDFIKTLADRLQTKAEYLVFNLPPRPGAWPGAIFTSDFRMPIVRGRSDDPALARGEPIEVDVTDLIGYGAGAQGGFWSLFSVAAKAGDTATVKLTFPDLRVIDILYEEVTKRAQQSPVAQAAARRGSFPFVIVKSYEGTLTLTVVKKANASAEAMADIKKAAIQARLEASALSEDHAVYKTTTPIVFAFEVMKAKMSPTNSGLIELAAAPASTFYTHQLAQQEAEIDYYRERMELATEALRSPTYPANLPEQQVDPEDRMRGCTVETRDGVFNLVCPRSPAVTFYRIDPATGHIYPYGDPPPRR
jgi:hypothetical protein